MTKGYPRVDRSRIQPVSLTGFLLVYLWGSVLTADAATYYVATTGNDANPCSQSQPCRTIAQGSSMLAAGDTLYIRGGTYTEFMDHGWQGFSWHNGTSWDNLTTYANYQNETVVIQPPSADTYAMRFENTTRYVEVNGLVIDAVNAYSGIKVDAYNGLEAKYIRIANSEIKNSPMHGILGGGSSCEFLKNEIHHNAEYGFYSGASYDSSGSLYEGNRIHDNGGYAMHMFNTPANIDNNVIRNNVMYKNGTGFWFTGNESPEWRTPPAVILSRGRSNAFYNNVLYDNHAGLFVGYGAVDSKIFNNTIYGNTTYGLDVNAAYSGSVNAQVINNIVYGNGTSQITNDATNTTLSNNLTDEDPRFVNPSAGDFHLQASSPAIDTGVNLSADGVAIDLEGTPRPQGAGYDVGAYEYQSGICNPPVECAAPPQGCIYQGATSCTCGTLICNTLPGDLNKDGRRDLADVRLLIYMLLGQQLKTPEADLTGDGAVTLADVQALIRLIVGLS